MEKHSLYDKLSKIVGFTVAAYFFIYILFSEREMISFTEVTNILFVLAGFMVILSIITSIADYIKNGPVKCSKQED